MIDFHGLIGAAHRRAKLGSRRNEDTRCVHMYNNLPSRVCRSNEALSQLGW